MPSSGIHGITGIIGASYVQDPYTKLGMVVGSLIPDGDLILSAILFLFTKDVEIGKKIHRSWSHSWLIHAIIAGIACLVLYFSRPLGNFFLACVAMMALHSLLDYIYIGYMTISDEKNQIEPGIAFLAPVSTKKWAFYPRVFSDKWYNIWIALDFLLDPILPAYFVWMSIRHQTNLAFVPVVTMVTTVFFAIFLVFFIIACVSKLPADRFTIAIHYPGLVFLMFIFILPFIFWPTLSQIH